MFKWLRKKRGEGKTIPFIVIVVTRTVGPHSKRGIHSTSEVFADCIKVEPSHFTPFINFNFKDGTRLSIHHDRLLEWRNRVQT